MTLIEFVKLDHLSDVLLHAVGVLAARVPPLRRVSLGLAQVSVNVPDDEEMVTPGLKMVVMEETTKVLEGVQLQVIYYKSTSKRGVGMRGYLVSEKLILVKYTNTYQPLIQKF